MCLGQEGGGAASEVESFNLGEVMYLPMPIEFREKSFNKLLLGGRAWFMFVKRAVRANFMAKRNVKIEVHSEEDRNNTKL